MKPWQVISARQVLNREPWLTVWEQTVSLPDGGTIEGYLLARARDYAMVFAVLPDGTVPIVRQYKHGIDAPSYDLPAGYLETPAEPPLSAAQRELREETGLTGSRWQSLGHLVIDSNRGDTRAHLFLAQDVKLTDAQDLDDTEALEVSYRSPQEVLAMVLRGEIDSLASVAGIMLAVHFLAQA